jgi:hypothetical protein
MVGPSSDTSALRRALESVPVVSSDAFVVLVWWAPASASWAPRSVSRVPIRPSWAFDSVTSAPKLAFTSVASAMVPLLKL